MWILCWGKHFSFPKGGLERTTSYLPFQMRRCLGNYRNTRSCFRPSVQLHVSSLFHQRVCGWTCACVTLCPSVTAFIDFDIDSPGLIQVFGALRLNTCLHDTYVAESRKKKYENKLNGEQVSNNFLILPTNVEIWPPQNL